MREGKRFVNETQSWFCMHDAAHDAINVLPAGQKEQVSVPPVDCVPAMHCAQAPHET